MTITNNTVFILGAGASAHLEYPTAFSLTEKICNNLGDYETKGYKNNRTRFQLFKELGYDKDKILEFRGELLTSTMYSIDAFLEHRPEFIEIGKIAISDALIPCEEEAKLFTKNENWYIYFFNRIATKTLEEFANNRVAFITFNYDRSLEHYLVKALTSTYGKTILEASKVLERIPIIHLYGKLDSLPWQDPKDSRFYMPTYNAEELQKSAKGIRIVTEDIDIESDPLFKEAHSLLVRAQKIYFIGLSYDPVNLNRLKMESFIGVSFAGTAYKLENSKSSFVRGYFRGTIDLGSSTEDAFDFVKERVSFS